MNENGPVILPVRYQQSDTREYGMQVSSCVVNGELNTISLTSSTYPFTESMGMMFRGFYFGDLNLLEVQIGLQRGAELIVSDSAMHVFEEDSKYHRITIGINNASLSLVTVGTIRINRDEMNGGDAIAIYAIGQGRLKEVGKKN